MSKVGTGYEYEWVSKFNIGSQITIDGDHSLKGRVTGILFKHQRMPPNYEISYIHNGDSKSAWIEEYRLEGAD